MSAVHDAGGHGSAERTRAAPAVRPSASDSRPMPRHRCRRDDRGHRSWRLPMLTQTLYRLGRSRPAAPGPSCHLARAGRARRRGVERLRREARGLVPGAGPRLPAGERPARAAGSGQAGLTAQVVVTPAGGGSFTDDAEARAALTRLEEDAAACRTCWGPPTRPACWRGPATSPGSSPLTDGSPWCASSTPARRALGRGPRQPQGARRRAGPARREGRRPVLRLRGVGRERR